MTVVAAQAARAQYLEIGQQTQPIVGGGWFDAVTPDLDLNGYPDFVSEETGTGTVVTHLNPGTQGWLTYQIIDPTPCCGGGLSVSTGLVDLDSYPDVIEGGYNGVKLLLNNQAGGLTTVVDLTPVIGMGVHLHFLTDVNGDGRDDLILQRNGADAASAPLIDLWINNYPSWTLTWSTVPPMVPGSFIEVKGIRDLNGDNIPDLVAYFIPPSCPTTCSPIYSWLGMISGTFGPLQTYGTDSAGILFVEDMDQDGLCDVVLGKQSSTDFRIQVAYGSSTQTLETPITLSVIAPLAYNVFANPFPIDLDADGSLDILMYTLVPTVVFQYDQKLLAIRGAGPRTYSQTFWEVFTLPHPHIVLPFAADFDQDGDQDIVGVPQWTDLFYFRNNAIMGTGCAGSFGAVPQVWVGNLTVGNGNFGVFLGNALANSTAVLGVSTAKVPLVGCGLGLDLGTLVLPSGTLGAFSTSPFGGAVAPIPLPNDPALLNLQVYLQWGIFDPGASFSVGTVPVALTPARTLILRN